MTKKHIPAILVIFLSLCSFELAFADCKTQAQAESLLSSKTGNDWSVSLTADNEVVVTSPLLSLKRGAEYASLERYVTIVCSAKEKCQVYSKDKNAGIKTLVKNSPEHRELKKRGLFQKTKIEALEKMCSDITSQELCEKPQAADKAKKIDFVTLCQQLVKTVLPVLKDYSL